jgi:hypothetical protein
MALRRSSSTASSPTMFVSRLLCLRLLASLFILAAMLAGCVGASHKDASSRQSLNNSAAVNTNLAIIPMITEPVVTVTGSAITEPSIMVAAPPVAEPQIEDHSTDLAVSSPSALQSAMNPPTVPVDQVPPPQLGEQSKMVRLLSGKDETMTAFYGCLKTDETVMVNPLDNRSTRPQYLLEEPKNPSWFDAIPMYDGSREAAINLRAWNDARHQIVAVILTTNFGGGNTALTLSTDASGYTDHSLDPYWYTDDRGPAAVVNVTYCVRRIS